MQEMEGCDIGKDPDVDGVPTDLDKTVETEVNVFVVNMLHTACWIVHAANPQPHTKSRCCLESFSIQAMLHVLP